MIRCTENSSKLEANTNRGIQKIFLKLEMYRLRKDLEQGQTQTQALPNSWQHFARISRNRGKRIQIWVRAKNGRAVGRERRNCGRRICLFVE